jgi:hypothetical protein
MSGEIPDESVIVHEIVTWAGDFTRPEEFLHEFRGRRGG